MKHDSNEATDSGDAQKLIDSLKEYASVVCQVPEMKEIGECVERVAVAHNLFDEMINKIHEILRYQMFRAVQDSIREFKQCKASTSYISCHYILILCNTGAERKIAAMPQ